MCKSDNVSQAVTAAVSANGIELWGGVECTINRVGDRYFSQLARSRHELRQDDIDRCASLGIRAMRYPVLWERVAAHESAEPDWSASDGPLARLRALNIDVVAGLLHHGSGPSYTSLIDPQFSEKFARFAAMAAARYPWIIRYTPINEPMTTARFSGLYGIWYPHGRDERVFKTALLAQCRATVLAMREIRRVNPSAELVQTEDLGKTYSTPALAYQADFNNELRWLAWDLLAGRVSHEHPLWPWLTECCGASREELLWFADNPCVPALIGVNHYVTSDRYLDERLERYPQHYHGGNGRDRYADIEASRSLSVPCEGLGARLTEAWERYRIPLIVSEVHIDAARNDHLRWIKESWDSTQAASRAGVVVKAFTAWALLGSFDWNSLLTADRGYYEPGAFDVRAPHPRETAVAGLLRELASGSAPTHPVLTGPGWWHRDDRFFCPPAAAVQAASAQRKAASPMRARPILITGATGTLGRAFAIICARRGLEYRLLGRAELDIAIAESVERAITEHAPWAVINAAGYVRIDEAERDAERCHRENVQGPAVLAATCARFGLPLVMFSSDMVFDGCRDSPYVETDDPRPLNVYGRSKADAEARSLALHPGTLVIRTSSFFGPWDESNYVVRALRSLSAGQVFHAPRDVTVSPTYVPDLVNTCLDLLIDGEHGTWHLTNEQAVTWADFAAQAAERAKVGRALLRPCANDELLLEARRPAYSALRSARSSLMPSLENALDRYFAQREVAA